jgi:hypothetical protein
MRPSGRSVRCRQHVLPAHRGRSAWVRTAVRRCSVFAFCAPLIGTLRTLSKRHIRAGSRTEVRLGSTHHSRARARRGPGSGRLSSVAEVQHSRPLRDRPSKLTVNQPDRRLVALIAVRAAIGAGHDHERMRVHRAFKPVASNLELAKPPVRPRRLKRPDEMLEPSRPRCAEHIHQQLVEWVPTTARCPSTSTPAPRRSPSRRD